MRFYVFSYILFFYLQLMCCHSSLKISVVLQMVRFFWVYPSRATGRLEIETHTIANSVSKKKE